MRFFSRPTSLDRLSTEARVVYTAFAVFMLLGYASSVWLYVQSGLGARPQAASRYYLGDESDPSPAAAAVVSPLNLAKPTRQLVETFHFHVFAAPLCLLVIAHLFMMCSLSLRVKVAIILTAHVALLLHLLAPLGVRLVSPAFAVLVFPSALLTGLSFLVLTAWPLMEMWRRPAEAAAG